MSFSVSHWSGRLGNNIQQVANCIMSAEKHHSTFDQQLDHDIISKFNVPFGDAGGSSGRFYAWEALVHCEHGCYEGGNEIGGTQFVISQLPKWTVTNSKWSEGSGESGTNFVYSNNATTEAVAAGTAWESDVGWVGVTTYYDNAGDLRVKKETLVAMSGISTGNEPAYPGLGG